MAGGGGSAVAVGAVRSDGERGETGRRPARPAVGHGNGLAAPRTLPGAAVCRTARRVARGSPRDPKDGRSCVARSVVRRHDGRRARVSRASRDRARYNNNIILYYIYSRFPNFFYFVL